MGKKLLKPHIYHVYLIGVTFLVQVDKVTSVCIYFIKHQHNNLQDNI